MFVPVRAGKPRLSGYPAPWVRDARPKAPLAGLRKTRGRVPTCDSL